MLYQLEVDHENLGHTEPTLSDMVKVAIKMLQKDDNGYFLFVEGAKIDMGHHSNKPWFALSELVEFEKAIEMARYMTEEKDTLIVVTADHSHAFTYNGYPARGSDVFGIAELSDIDQLPYSTLSYANGKGYNNTYHSNGTRQDLRLQDLTDKDTRFIATVQKDSETHGAEDVGVWASGPHSHLFVGAYEQNVIPIIMANASGIGPFYSAAQQVQLSKLQFMIPIMILTIFNRW
jgi:alkaline phosphatase